MNLWPKPCRCCWRRYTRAEFFDLAKPPKGDVMELDGSPGEWLVLRQCECGTTLAIDGEPSAQRITRKAPELYLVLVQLLDEAEDDAAQQRTRARAARILRECR